MRCYSVRWLTAGLCRPLRTAKPLPSATGGKLTKLVSLPGSTVACHVASLPSAADGKDTFVVGGWRQRACILALFSVFFNPTIFTANIYDIYRYISQGYLTAHKFHRTYIYSSIHSYIASSIKIAKLHIHITMQSFIKIASSIIAS